MDDNSLCGFNRWGGYGTYTTEGITKLCEGLTESAVTSLRCAAAPVCLLSTPLDTTSPLSRARSLQDNHLGPKGGAALADGLKGNSTLKELK